jgi:O-acetyl-ADP-ribose deacetylase
VKLSTFRRASLLTGDEALQSEMNATKKSFLEGSVQVVVGDITKQDVEAIVNAANASLLGGGGVDGAIHRAGGPEILEECREIRRTRFPEGLPTGEAVITTGGKLPALYVIHTVGPIYGEHRGKEAELLANCYHNSLTLAVEKNLTSVAFPAISTGVYGYPLEEAAEVSSRTIENFLATDRQLKEVRLVFFQPRDAKVFLAHQKFSE